MELRRWRLKSLAVAFSAAHGLFVKVLYLCTSAVSKVVWLL